MVLLWGHGLKATLVFEIQILGIVSKPVLKNVGHYNFILGLVLRGQGSLRRDR